MDDGDERQAVRALATMIASWWKDRQLPAAAQPAGNGSELARTRAAR
jgi:hypothetical protein